MDRSVAAIIDRLHANGVSLHLADGEPIIHAPAGWLTPDRKAWLSAHKAELLAALAVGEPANDPPLLAEVWTPTGVCMVVEADNPEHAEWLMAANPPNNAGPVQPHRPAAKTAVNAPQSDLGPSTVEGQA